MSIMMHCIIVHANLLVSKVCKARKRNSREIVQYIKRDIDSYIAIL